MTINEMADAIYLDVYGHLDDKEYRAAKTQEIADWLKEGDLLPAQLQAGEVKALAREWRDYDASAF